MKNYDVAVIGLGAMGSTTALALADQGLRVLGLDQYAPPHCLGSSHGQTRIIREAYFEHPDYVPLLQAAYQAWERLEQRSGQRLFSPTGGLMIGPPDCRLLTGSRESAERYRIPHRLYSAAEAMAQYPGFELPGDYQVLEETRAGILYPERCISTCLSLAQAAGADLHYGQALQAWYSVGSGYKLQTNQDHYTAEQLVFCAGAWLPALMPELELPLTVTRQVLYWFDTPQPNPFAWGSLPVFLIEFAPDTCLYGFPDQGEGFKVALHVPGSPMHPQALSEQTVQPEELEQMRVLLQRFFPKALEQLRQSAICMYTNTPNGHFLIDQHPQFSGVWLVSPCSGHGFKFASALGVLLARTVLERQLPPELALFRAERQAGRA